MSRRSGGLRVEERLARMLVVVPYLVQHPGTTLGEASTLFALPARQLRRDLELLLLAGLPPYGPGDLIDVDIDEDGAIWIAMADHFARPLRLTRPEALAVYVRATELAATPGIPGAPALAAALGKLRDALGEETLGDAAVVAAAERGAPPAHLEAVRSAAEEHRRCRISYAAASTGEQTERVVDPEVVFVSAGHWYLAAWDVDLDDERLLRIDRIAAVAQTDEHFTPRGLEGAGRPLYTPGGSDVDVRVRLRPAARWVAEYYVAIDPAELDDGSLEVTLPTGQIRWLARLLLRVGADAEVLAPPGVGEAVLEEAAAALERYRPAT